MIKKKRIGRVVYELQGFRVRQLVERHEERNVPTGRYGIYAGKKKHVDETFNRKELAIEHLQNLIKKRNG